MLSRVRCATLLSPPPASLTKTGVVTINFRGALRACWAFVEGDRAVSPRHCSYVTALQTPDGATGGSACPWRVPFRLLRVNDGARVCSHHQLSRQRQLLTLLFAWRWRLSRERFLLLAGGANGMKRTPLAHAPVEALEYLFGGISGGRAAPLFLSSA